MSRIIAYELEVIGSHGMQAHQYPGMMDMIKSGKLKPEKLVTEIVDLQRGVQILEHMEKYSSLGITVIDRF